MHVCVCICAHKRVYLFMSVFECVWVSDVFICVCIYVSVYVWVGCLVCLYVYVSVCYVLMNMHVYTHWTL